MAAWLATQGHVVNRKRILRKINSGPGSPRRRIKNCGRGLDPVYIESEAKRELGRVLSPKHLGVGALLSRYLARAGWTAAIFVGSMRPSFGIVARITCAT
jgi:hypothetical protein